MEIDYKKAINKTLIYKSMFKYPVSIYQLFYYLMVRNSADPRVFKKELTKLVGKGKVHTRKNKHYFWHNHVPLNWNLRAKNSQEILKENDEAFKLLESIPWIKMLAVTGSVACYNAETDDDLDTLIVTSKGRVWTTRFFAVLLLKLIGGYPYKKKTARKFCPNIIVAEDNMGWDNKKRNVYIAHEIITMHPIINRDDTYFKFIKKNAWVSEFFGNFSVDCSGVKDSSDKKSRIMDFIENILMRFQKHYMKKHQTKEITNKNFIHFNKVDRADSILADFEKLTDVLD